MIRDLVIGVIGILLLAIPAENAMAKKSVSDSINLFVKSAESEDLTTLKDMLSKKTDINGFNKNGWTALHLAARNGNLNTIKFLIDQGATVDIKTQRSNLYQRTPLSEAVWKGHLDIAKYLISKGANPKWKNNYQKTLLHIAAGHGHLDIVNYLINEDLDVDARNHLGETSLYLATWRHLDIVKLLIANGASLTIGTKNRPFLYNAVRNGQFEILKYLVSKGADDELDNNKYLYLHLAARYGHGNIIQNLVEEGADIHFKYKGRALLHTALFYGNSRVPLITYLLKKGASVNQKDDSNRYPLAYAASMNQKEIIDLLITNGANQSLLSESQQKLVKLILNPITLDLNYKTQALEYNELIDLMHAIFKSEKLKTNKKPSALKRKDFRFSPSKKRIYKKFLGIDGCSGEPEFLTIFNNGVAKSSKDLVFYRYFLGEESVFPNKIKIGMKIDEIKRLLGTPIKENKRLLVYAELKNDEATFMEYGRGNVKVPTFYLFFKDDILIGIWIMNQGLC